MFNENKKNNEEVTKEKNKIDVTEVTDDAEVTDDTEDTEDEADSSAAEDNSKQQTERTFTQRQVNAMMSKEKRQGRAAAYAELGIDPKDESLLNIIKAITGSQNQNQNQNQQLSVDQKKIEEAENRAMVAEAKAEAMILGANSAYIDDIVSLALTKVTDDTDIKTVIEELKTKYPVWFGDEESDGTKTKGKSDKKTVGQRGTGASPKNNSGSKTNSKEDGLGKRLAANRQKQQKSSFWS